MFRNGWLPPAGHARAESRPGAWEDRIAPVLAHLAAGCDPKTLPRERNGQLRLRNRRRSSAPCLLVPLRP